MGWFQRRFGRRAKVKKEPPTVDADALPAAPVAVARNPELEAAIEEAIDRGLDAREELAVYGDWLATHGDPRGELIAMQLSLSRAVGGWSREHHPRTIEPFRVPTGDLVKDAEALIARHASLRPTVLTGLKRSTKWSSFEWSVGFWRTLRPRPYHQGSLERMTSELAILFAHPSARFLERLWIGAVLNEDIAKVLPAVLPASLRELYLGDYEFPGDSELSWSTTGDASVVYTRAPQLTRLVLQGASIHLGTRIELPNLRSFETITTHLPDAAIDAIAASELPELERLVLWTGMNPDAMYDPTALLELLATASFPKLRHLGIRNCAASDAVVEAFLRSPLRATVRELDLSLGTMTAAGARMLASAKDLRLDTLDVTANLLADDVSELRSLATTVSFDNQRPEENDAPAAGAPGPAPAMRYAPITE